MERASGVLMPVSSLPGIVGIGTFGREAYDFVDFLARTHQRYWQVLPLTTTSFGDSPYQSFSAFAGNPYFIDIQDLVRLGYLTEQDLVVLPFGDDPENVDYGTLFRGHRALLERALPSFSAAPPEDFEEFCEANGSWLEPYCEFMTVKEEFGLKAYYEWPQQYRSRGKASAALCAKHPERMRYHQMTQYFFYRHWKSLKDLARLCGDVGHAGALPRGRHGQPHVRGRYPARPVFLDRSVLGQPHLRLGGHGRGRLCLVGRTPAR